MALPDTLDMHYNPQVSTQRSSMSEPVRIICATGTTPIMASGVLLDRNEDQVMIRCGDAAARIECGAKVVLTFRTGDERWTGLVEQVQASDDGVEIRLVTPSSHAAEKREYPRLHAGIPLRYRVATENEAADWIAGAETVSRRGASCVR